MSSPRQKTAALNNLPARNVSGNWMSAFDKELGAGERLVQEGPWTKGFLGLFDSAAEYGGFKGKCKVVTDIDAEARSDVDHMICEVRELHPFCNPPMGKKFCDEAFAPHFEDMCEAGKYPITGDFGKVDEENDVHGSLRRIDVSSTHMNAWDKHSREAATTLAVKENILKIVAKTKGKCKLAGSGPSRLSGAMCIRWMTKNGDSVTGKTRKQWHYDRNKMLGTLNTRREESVRNGPNSIRKRRRNHFMRNARCLFTFNVQEPAFQATEVRAVRSRLRFSKRVSMSGGGIAMSGDIRGYGLGVETLYMHTGAGDMPERYQVYLDFDQFDFVAWNKAAAEVCLEDLEEKYPGDKMAKAKAKCRRVMNGTGVLE